jgi:hypothetical protein
MQIAEALRFPFEDKKWIEKILIAAVLILTVIGSLAVIGWMAEIIRRVIRRDDEPLAGWGDLGKYFVDGIKLFVIGLIWMLPFILISMCVGVFSGLASSLTRDSSTGSGAFALLNLCLSFLGLPYALIVSFLIPPLYCVYAMHGEFGHAVNPARAWELARVNLGGFAIAWIVAGILAVVASSIGLLLCFVGVYLLSAYAVTAAAHLYGQAGREAMASLPAA